MAEITRRRFIKATAATAAGVYATTSLPKYLISQENDVRVSTIEEVIPTFEKKGFTDLYLTKGDCRPLGSEREILRVEHKPGSSYTKLYVRRVNGNSGSLNEIDSGNQESIAAAFKDSDFEPIRIFKQNGGELGEQPIDLADLYDSASNSYVKYGQGHKDFTPGIRSTFGELLGCVADFLDKNQ